MGDKLIHKLIDKKELRNRKIRTAFETLRQYTNKTYEHCIDNLSHQFHLSRSRIRDIIREGSSKD